MSARYGRKQDSIENNFIASILNVALYYKIYVKDLRKKIHVNWKVSIIYFILYFVERHVLKRYCAPMTYAFKECV